MATTNTFGRLYTLTEDEVRTIWNIETKLELFFEHIDDFRENDYVTALMYALTKLKGLKECYPAFAELSNSLAEASMKFDELERELEEHRLIEEDLYNVFK